MDTLAALALATEPPSDELLLLKPNTRYEKVINSTMWRNIFGHAIYQVVVVMTFLYAGVGIFNLQDYDKDEPFFVDENWVNDLLTRPENASMEQTSPICWKLAKQARDSGIYDTPTAKCTLYTLVFQVFVMMTVFNIINARKLGDKDFNVFRNFFNNSKFIGILMFIIGVQVWMCQNGGMWTRTSPLTLRQHLIVGAFAAFELVWGLVIKKFLPSHLFDRF